MVAEDSPSSNGSFPIWLLRGCTQISSFVGEEGFSARWLRRKKERGVAKIVRRMFQTPGKRGSCQRGTEEFRNEVANFAAARPSPGFSQRERR